MGRILALDYGKARIGLAISDQRKIIASPLFTIKTENSLQKTSQLIFEKTLSLAPFDVLVIGLPLLLSGQEGEMAKEVRRFAKSLEEVFKIPVELWDERLTSSQADRILKEGCQSRKERAKAIDTLAAVLILQNYLELHGHKYS